MIGKYFDDNFLIAKTMRIPYKFGFPPDPKGTSLEPSPACF